MLSVTYKPSMLSRHYGNIFNDFTYNNFTYNNFAYNNFTYNNFTYNNFTYYKYKIQITDSTYKSLYL